MYLTKILFLFVLGTAAYDKQQADNKQQPRYVDDKWQGEWSPGMLPL